MATELTRVLQQGGFTDDTLERLLAGSLQSRPDVAGYDVAKDYIKQVFGQLYGEGDVASSAPTGVAAESRSSSAQAFASTVATVALNHSSTESSDNSGAHGLLLGPAPPSRTPAQHAAHTAASGLTPPPWTGAIGRGPVAGAGAAASSSSAGGADDEPERPRPRPHHGRIKEQLDLLQNADQLAAIISVATTAATTAAAAAVKQTMQTPPPLPPGAYARMHAAGQAVYGLPVVASGHRVPQAMQVAAAGAASARVAADGLGDDSPDPQPQNRQGALVSPHRRSTPMVLMRRPEADVRAAESIEPGAAPGEQDEQPVAGEQIGRAGAALGFEDAQLRRQRLRWSQRRGMPLAPAPARDVDGDTGAVSLGDAGSINANVGAVNSAAAGGDAGNSNLRMVRLGVPKITARTPTPARQLRAIVGDLRPLHDQQVQRGDVLHMGAGSRTAEAETRPSSYEPAAMRAVEWPAGAAHAGQADQPGRLPAPISNSCNSVRQQQQPGMQGPVMMAGDAPAEGFYVAGGESIFARGLGAAAGPGPVRQAAVGGAAPWASEPSAARPRRAALPEDVQNAFRSTLEFIADPDGVRAQQHLPPAWAALEDVQEREEAQREAEELLGGAFDYAAVKRELERAKRASRLLQQAAGPAAPPSAAGSAAAAGGVPPKPAGSRGRAGNGPGTAGPGAAAVAGPPGMAAAPPGDFAGLLPPPHSVWDVDEAWFDLDEFTKAVEAEVAYRAAASVAPAGRGSPGPTLAGANGTATTPSAGQAAQTGRAGARLPGARATLAGGVTATAEGKGPGYADTAARSGGRKRASSPGPRTAASPVAATAEDMSPSPPRAVRKTQATGPVRVAFGRRVEEPSKATGPGASRTRAGSPPTARGSPGRARTRTRKVATSSAAVPPSPSSPGDAVHQVLSALASVLLSEGDVGDDDDDHDGDGRAATSGAEAPAGGAAGGRDLGREDGAACRGDHGAEVRTDAARQSPAPIPLQLPVERRTAAAGGSETPMPQQGQLAGPVQPPAAPISGQNSDRQSPIAAAAAPVAVAAAASSGAAAPPPWLPPPPVLPSWPSSTSKSRPRFQYVVDTAHPPVTVTRLPAWAASAVAAEGAPTAYAAALGAAPTGLGFGTPTRRRPPPAATASPSGMPFAAPAANMPMQQPFDVITGEAVPQAARGGRNFVAATNTTVLRFEQQEQRQVPQQQQLQQVFLAPADLPSNTHVLPPQAAAAAMAAAAAADAPAASRRARDPDPGQQWEKAVLQAVEDEVVSRLAAVQLAAQGRDPEISPQNLSGMVPPLVDLELSRRLVCDVLRDNLRSLMSSQRHQGQGAPAVQEDSGAPTLEEVVAALAAAQVLPPRLQQPQSQQESQQQRGNMRPCEGPGAQPGYVDAGGVSDCAADLPGVDELSRLAAATAGYADWAGSGAVSGDGTDVRADSSGMFSTAEQAASAHAFKAAIGVSEADADGGAVRPQSAGSLQTWQPVYAGRRAAQASQGTQAAPDTATAAAKAYDQRPATLAQSRDAGTSASSEDLTWPAHGAAALPHSPAAALDSATPASGPREPLRVSPSQAGPPVVASTAGPVAAAATATSPLGFVTAAIAPALPAAPYAAATGIALGMGAPHALAGPQPAAPGQDQVFAAGPAVAAALSAAAAQPSPSRSDQAVQAYGMQARGVQAHGAEARGVQAYGVVEARAVQAYGAEARGTQAVGAQERGTQAAGVMDSSSQADPPLPHYLLQAALAAGLSYGAAPPQPNFTTTAGLGGGQQVLGPDGAPLTMPRPFYLVPADNTQRPASLNIYGAASGLALPPFARGEGSRPPLNLPGLSKLRDSSDVESSTDSMGRNLKGPGARARAAALEALRQASRFSLDSDDGLLQRSYAQLELATLTARPVQLEQHRLSSESAQPPAPGLGQPRAGKGGPHSQALSDPAAGAGSAAGGSGSGGAGALAWGDASRAHGQGAASHVASAGISGRGAPTYLTQAMGPSSNDSATWSHVTSLNAASQATGRSPGAVEDNDNTAGSVSPAPNSGGAANGASTASLNGASRVSSFAMSERSSAVPVAGQARQGSGDKDGSVGNASGASAASSGPARAHLSASPGGSAPRGSKDGSALPSGGLSHAASGASLASTAAAKSAVSGQDTPARPGAAGPGIPAAPATPAVADDELVGDEGDFEDGDDPDQIHSVYFSSSDDGRTARSRGSGHGGAASASADIPAAGGLRQASASGAGSAVGSGSANAVASRTGSQSLGASGRSNVADQEASPPPPAGQVVRNDGRATVAGGGGRYGVGAEEAGDFALSDDELLDDVEVARVLEEEDAKSAEDALEGEDERGLSEDDEELRQMEGQVTVLEDSDPEDEASAAAARPSPGAVDNQGGPADVAVFTTGLQEGSAVARGGRDEGVAKGGAAISATDGSVSERGDGSSSSGRKAHEASASASPRGVSVRSSSGAGNASVSWIDTQGPAGAAAGVGSKADDNEVALRVSTERAAHASLAPLGRLQSTTSSSGSGATRTTAAPPLSSSSQQQRSELGSTGTVPPVRPALAPLQTSAVRPAVSAMEGSGALQLPDSPGKRPSLANYHGPTRQLWRPPSAEPQDPLLSSSETLMASSEASGPVLDPLSRALLDGQRRAREVGPRSGLEAVAERARALGLDDSIGESSLDVSASADSVPASSVFQPRAAAGGTLPRSLAHSSRAGPLSPGVDSELDSDEEEGPAAPGGLRQATQPRTDAAGLGLPGRGSSRHDGAVFRLRQYGARRRKLMQQIGVQDPLLLSSAASLSTDSSTVSDSEDGDGYPSFARRG
ncbi:hypothetical protein PLESTF_001323600 [Pleodorina starrii]|nr:hypothetical protein PLESTF_001323600 [Pleodorina starrii]